MEHYTWPFLASVVMDWSWAFIHSFLLEWNDMPIEKYLQLEYQYCESLDKSILRDVVLIKICYSHFMHIILQTVDKKYCKLKLH